jgi:NAD(P)-dependent dehydrogenase (short-subunit alcohol dehydrogenase family)
MSSAQTEFHGRVIAISGAASGIGLGIARRLLAEGAEVFSLDLHPGPAGRHIEADVRDPESMTRAVATIRARSGRIDGFVANAGVRGPDVGVEDMPVEAFDEVLSVNLRGVFVSCQAFGRAMLDQGGGRIVVIASMSGNRIINVPMRIAHYHAAKGGVIALARALAVEWGPRGVRVNALSPGYIRTPLAETDTEHHALWEDMTVLGRLGTVEEVAGGVRYLLSDDAAFCCGTDLLMDGGYVLR